MGVHQTRKILHRKPFAQQSERQPTEWEKILVNNILDKAKARRLKSKIYEELIQLNIKKNFDLKMGRRSKKTFSKEDIQIANRYVKKKCSTSLVIGKVLIKTTMRYHLTSVRMAVIK